MKQRFLKLVEAVKECGVVEELYKNLNAQGIKTTFNRFKSENKKLIANIEQWKNQYKQGEPHYLFKDGESIEYPMEIALMIHLIKEVTEEDLFENPNDLTQEISNIGNDMAIAVAVLVEDKGYFINEITSEEICRYLLAIQQIHCGCCCDSINLAEAEDH